MSTTANRQHTTPDAVLAAVSELAPSIAERAPEIESARQLPTDLIDDLIAAGCFRMLLPPSFGGSGFDLASSLRVFEALSAADASVGWTVMNLAGNWVDLAGIPRPVLDDLYADGPVLVAGAFSPSGIAVPVDGGYRISGRWAFASGSPHASRLFGNCLEESDGEPQLRIALFTLDEAQVEDTWNVVGLCGTASHHFRVDNVIVPAERTWAVMTDEHSLDETILHVPPTVLFGLSIAATALGIAGGAVNDITALATERVPLLAGTPLSMSATFHHDLAIATTELQAARALVYECADRAWRTATDREEPTLEPRAHIRAAAAWAVETAVNVVTTAYRAGGGGAVYLDSPLQRRLRDVNALAQHFLVRPDTLTTAGAVLAGQEIDLPIF
jgi:alkylation response protein AidB-like acyl-CoA dehydrogenase